MLKTMKIFNWLLAVFVLFSLSSCEVEEIDFVELSRLEVKDIKPKEIVFDVTAILDNPNGFSVKVVDSDLDLFLEGNNMGKATLMEEVKIEAGVQKPYDLKIKASGDNLQTKLLPVMFSAALTGKVNVKLEGAITGKVSFVKRKVNVNITEEVKFKNES